MFRITSLFLITVCALLVSCNKDLSPEEQLAEDIKIIQDYIKSKGLTAQSTASGLHYVIDKPGGGGSPNLQSTVTVHYKGYFTDGKVFDQTGQSPATFKLAQLITGWQEAIPLLQKGGSGTFMLPSALGYGPIGSGGVSPNTVLIFDITLVDFQ